MKQKVNLILVLLFVSMNSLYAAEAVNENLKENENSQVVCEQQETQSIKMVSVKIKENQMPEKNNFFKKFLKKRKQRFLEKFSIKKMLSPKAGMPVVGYIGIGLTLTGMILSFSGAYILALFFLLPAIVLLIIALVQIKRRG